MPSRDKSRGTWRGQIRYQGKVYRKDFPTKREAQDWEILKRQDLQNQTPDQAPTVMALVDFCNKYLDFAEVRFVKNTYENKQRVCRRFIKYVGNIPVDEVTAKHVHDYLNTQLVARSPKGFNEDYKHLRSMWSWGQDILDFPSNPVTKIRRLPDERKPQYTPPTADVLKVLAATTREERVFLNCYLHTAARRSEIFRWEWNADVNFDRREVRLGTRKTKDGSMEHEWLPMNDELYEELWWWWKNRPIKDTPHVFVSTCNRHYGKPFTTRRRFMRGLCERAGVKPFGFHALRRYVASLLADTHKISAKTIQRILRHKSVSTTERYIQNINHDLGATMNLLSKKSTQEEHPKYAKKVENMSQPSEIIWQSQGVSNPCLRRESRETY
jgi:integrase